jgi:hypothetical protein
VLVTVSSDGRYDRIVRHRSIVTYQTEPRPGGALFALRSSGRGFFLPVPGALSLAYRRRTPGTSRLTSASPRSTRAKPCPPQRRAHRAFPRKPGRNGAHPPPASKCRTRAPFAAKRRSANRRGRGQAEDGSDPALPSACRLKQHLIAAAVCLATPTTAAEFRRAPYRRRSKCFHYVLRKSAED